MIANAIPDAGTQAYNEALAHSAEKDLNIVTAVTGVAGAAVRAVGSLVETANVASNVQLIAVGANNLANPVSSTLARVVPGNINPTTLGAPGAIDVFVTNASELNGLTAAEIAKKLTIPESPTGFRIFEFPSANVTGIASPVGRTNPGFIGGGKTAGGASEFVIPNGSLPSGTTQKVIP
jgi:hypothetical protein